MLLGSATVEGETRRQDGAEERGEPQGHLCGALSQS